MSRYLVTLNSSADRVRAVNIIAAAPAGARVEIKAAKRSTGQNSKLWAMLTDVAMQLPWHGQKIRPDDYKLLFLDALKREKRLVPALEGDGFVDLGRSSSDLSKDEMSDLLTLIESFGANHGVIFSEQLDGVAA